MAFKLLPFLTFYCLYFDPKAELTEVNRNNHTGSDIIFSMVTENNLLKVCIGLHSLSEDI